MRRRFSKIGKFVLYTLLGTVGLSLLLAILINLSPVQQWILQKASNRLGSMLGTRVEIGHINWVFPNRIMIDQIDVWDQGGDSLIHIKRVQTVILKLDLSGQHFAFGATSLVKPTIRFHSDAGYSGLNFLFLTEWESDSSNSGTGHLSLKNLNLSEASFAYRIRDKAAPTDRSFDEHNMFFGSIDAVVQDFHLLGDSLDFRVKKMNFQERSGLIVKHLACKTKIHSKGMEFNNMLLRTTNSSLEDYLAFDYSTMNDLADFLSKVHIRSHLADSRIAIEDLAYFSSNLKPYAEMVFALEGDFEGTVDNFKCRDLNAGFGDRSLISGDLRFKGLPDLDNTFVDLDLQNLTTSADDVAKLLKDSLPQEANRFEVVSFHGFMTGFISDFSVDGVFSTSLGKLQCRAHLLIPKGADMRYTGTLLSQGFELGRLLGTDDLGKVAFQAKVTEGIGNQLKNMRLAAQLDVESAVVKGRDLKDMSANARLDRGELSADIQIKDPKLEMAGSGEMVLQSKSNHFQIKSNIARADLEALGLDSVRSIVSGQLELDLDGSNIDDLHGLLSVQDVQLFRNGQSYQLNNLFLSSGNAGGQQLIRFRSDFADMNMRGIFNLSDMKRISNDFLHNLFPDYYPSSDILTSQVVVSADLRIRKNDFLSVILPVELELGNGNFVANYDAAAKSLAVDGIMDRIRFEEFELKNNFLNIRKAPHQLLNMTADVERITMNDSDLLQRAELNASILPNDVDFMLNFSDTTDPGALRSFGHVHFSPDSIAVTFEETAIYSYGRRWQVRDQNRIIQLKSHTLIEYLTLESAGEMVFLTGKLSDRRDEKLSIWLTGFHLNNLNAFLKPWDVEVSGLANGSIDLFQVLDKPLVKANLSINRLLYNQDTLGDFRISSTSGSHPLEMKVEASIVTGMFKNLSMTGRVDWRNTDDNLDLDLQLRGGSVRPFEIIFKGLASDFTGAVDGKVHIGGNFTKPKLNGYLEFLEVGLKVDYLQTRYYLNNRVKLTENAIEFEKIAVRDPEGNTATARGRITHKMFDDFVLDIKIEDARKILAINTTREDSDVFYGKAYGTGSILFKGPLDDIYININARSEKGTKLYIPVYSEGENALVDYISFYNPEQKTARKSSREAEGLTMDMTFQITEDAEFELLFDELLDDKIYGRGVGSVKMEMNSSGDFYMFGDFEITEGSYPFASPMLVSEKFILKKGGKIRWDGDPYNAYIDMEAAIRRNKANPYQLMLGSSFIAGNEDRFRGEVAVDVQLFLRGELFNPDITFGIDLPNNATISGSSEFLSVLNRVRADEDELNRQVFSLVTFGSFSPTNFSNYQNPDGAFIDLNQTMYNSLSSFLSGQINNWISQYDQNWEIGLDWQARNKITEQNAELILSIRRKLFNDRLEIAGSVDANPVYDRNPYNVNLVYNVRRDGKIRVKAFQKLANDPAMGNMNNVTTTGFGLFFRTQFDRIRLIRKPEKELSKVGY